MPRQKKEPAASDSSPATNGAPVKKRRGRPPGKMRVTRASKAEAAADMIALPRTGPGKRKMVRTDSLDGIAATIANEAAAEIAAEIAPMLVGRCRAIAEKMVRSRMELMLERLG